MVSLNDGASDNERYVNLILHEKLFNYLHKVSISIRSLLYVPVLGVTLIHTRDGTAEDIPGTMHTI